ncbi:MAG: hypothetical protein COB54_08425 [Alphaproteobacteria bacterium]|nr:MAG: hypothetical protein COB54_08425 [Alphaproteobacteria bacterium]
MASSIINNNHKSSLPASPQAHAIQQEVLESVILIVDDDELHCQMISIILTQDGFKNLHFANDGRQALKMAIELNPDMIILDILMPNIDGLEVCRQLREMKHFRTIPIIAHTIKKKPEDRAEIYDAGATDIFPKPVSEREVQNRVYMHLKYARMVKDLKQYHTRLTRDLEIAHSMQNALLPEVSQLEYILASHGLDIDYHYESTSELGGDFWGIDVIDDDQLLVYITDFSGHGIASALNTFRLHTLISNYQLSRLGKSSSPAERLKLLNRTLHGLLPVEQFATMLCGIIDLKKDTFTYASAASTTPLKLTVGTQEVISLDPTGFPLGMIADATYENHVVPFRKGELIFLYSDVLTESLDHTGQMIGDDFFLEMCKQTSGNLTDDQVFLNRLMKGFDAKVVRPLPDDLTAITLKRL